MESKSTHPHFTFLYRIFLLLLLGYFCILMLQITLQYLPYNTDVAFLRIKQDYIGLLHYRLSFFIHVYSSLFVLLAGFTQFSGNLLKKAKKLHKTAGKFYVLIVIFLSAPS